MTSMDKATLNPLIDCDYLIFRAGFSADTQAKEQFGDDEYLNQEYLHWALANTRTAMTYMFDEVFPHSEWARVFIGGEGNYRMTIAQTIPKVIEGWTYKGNRDTMHKPKYYSEIKSYLVDQWGADRVNGRESDDEVSILQYKAGTNPPTTCIVSQDKDLLNTPGWNYNPVKKEFQYVSREAADANFWTQVAMGDSSDNIPGLPKIGPKKARALVEEAGRADRAKLAVERAYTAHYGKGKGEGMFWDNASLLWIQRKDWKGWDGSKIKREVS